MNICNNTQLHRHYYDNAAGGHSSSHNNLIQLGKIFRLPESGPSAFSFSSSVGLLTMSALETSYSLSELDESLPCVVKEGSPHVLVKK